MNHVYVDRYDLGPGDEALLRAAVETPPDWAPCGNVVIGAKAFKEWWYQATGGSEGLCGSISPPRVQGHVMHPLTYPAYGWLWYVGPVLGGPFVVGLPAAAHVVLAVVWWEDRHGRQAPERLKAAATVAWASGGVRWAT